MRHRGKLSTWNDDKGFGFIEPNDGGPRVFVHIKAFGSRNRRPVQNDVVSYRTGKDKQGRINASKAAIAGGKVDQHSGPKGRASGIAFSILFLGGIGLLAYVGRLHLYFLYWYLGMSFVALLAYVRDKSAARSGNWRTKENTLYLLGLIGGWPGALIAQEALRHKSKKISFKIVFSITVVSNCAFLIWLQTGDGQMHLQRLLSALEALLISLR